MLIGCAYNPNPLFTEWLLCARNCAKFFSFMILFCPESNPVKHVLFFPFHPGITEALRSLRDNWGSEKLGDLSRVTQLGRWKASGSLRSQQGGQDSNPGLLTLPFCLVPSSHNTHWCSHKADGRFSRIIIFPYCVFLTSHVWGFLGATQKLGKCFRVFGGT